MATLNGPFGFHDVDVVFACCVLGGRVTWHHSTVGPHDLIKHEVEPSAVLRLHSAAGSTPCSPVASGFAVSLYCHALAASGFGPPASAVMPRLYFYVSSRGYNCATPSRRIVEHANGT